MKNTDYLKQDSYHESLKSKIDVFVHQVYRTSREFPKDELYGSTSQLRRASLSVALNFIEGYARRRDKVYKNFLEISYGSLQESLYLLDFALKEGYIKDGGDYKKVVVLGNEVGAMLWGIIRRL